MTQPRGTRGLLPAAVLAALLVSRIAAAGNLPGMQFAWGENVGWLNFNPDQGPGVTLTDNALSGFAWGENIGWVNLSPDDGGVVHDGAGNFSGFAWGENVGWINFAPTGGGVFIDMLGRLRGYAWGENIGWITFNVAGNDAALIRTPAAPMMSAPGILLVILLLGLTGAWYLKRPLSTRGRISRASALLPT
jgi:hypothetical protein